MKALRIKDICDKGSSSLRQKDVEGDNGKFPVFGASGYIGSIDSYHQEKEYIAIVKDGSGIGRVTFMPPFSSVIGTMQYILPKDGYNIKYISYCLQSLDLSAYKQGAAIPHIYFRDYGERIVNVEENLTEQERIVTLLDAEFAKIDAIKANAEKQLKDAKALFQSALNDYFNDTSDWSKYNISECFKSINNGANIKQTKGASGLPITRIETLSNGIFNTNRLGYANIFESDKYQKYILNEGDILMSHINSLEFVGRSVVYHKQIPIVIHGMNLLRLVPLSFINSDFFVYLSKTSYFKKLIGEITHKSVNQASFNTTALKAIQIPVPSIKIQKQIVEKLDILSSKIQSLQQNYEQTITLCNDLKQSILKDIFG